MIDGRHPPTKPVCGDGRCVRSGFYHQANWPLHKAYQTQYMPFVHFSNGQHCLEVSVCKALKSRTLRSIRKWVQESAYLSVRSFMSMFVSRHLYMSEGVSIFVCHRLRLYLILHRCLCVCLALWRHLLALTVLRRGWCHFSQWQAVAHAGWPQVSRLIVSGQSLSALLHLCFYQPPSVVPEGATTEKCSWHRLRLFRADWGGSHSSLGLEEGRGSEIGKLKPHLNGLLLLALFR